MNEELRKLLEEITAKHKEANAILAKEKPTAEEVKTATSLMEEIESLQQQVKSKREESKSDDLKIRLGASKDFLEDPVLAKLGKETTPAPEMVFTKQTGTDLVDLIQRGYNRVDPVLRDFEDAFTNVKQMQAIRGDDYTKAFEMYLRKGSLDKMGAFERKNLNEGVDTEGGFLVPPQILSEMIKRDIQGGDFLSMVRRIPVTSDRILAPRLDYQTDDIYSNPFRVQWTGEAIAPGAVTNPTIGQIEIPVFEGTMELPMSRTLLEDAGFPVQSFFTEELGGSYNLGIENVGLNGTGVAQPRGLLANPGGTAYEPPTVNVGNPVTGSGLIDLIYSLPPQYAANSAVLMNRTNVFRTLAKITQTDQGFVFGSFGNQDHGLAGRRIETLLGYPIKFSAFMPNSGAANNIMAYGDWRRTYWLTERLGMSIRIQDLPREPWMYIVARFRVGGQVVQPRAMEIAVQS